MNNFVQTVGERYEKELLGFNFVKSQSRLIKPTIDGWIGIALCVTQTSSQRIRRLEAHGHIRLERVEKIYAPHQIYLQPKDAKHHQTLTVNCMKFLKNQSLLFGFDIDDEKSFTTCVDAYLLELKESIIPWLEKHSTEQAIFESLIDKDPMKWITSDRLTRYPVLMAILAKQGDWDSFDNIAAEFLDYCKKPHAQVHQSLAESMLNIRQLKQS